MGGGYKLADWKDCIVKGEMFQREISDRKEKVMQLRVLENTVKKMGNN